MRFATFFLSTIYLSASASMPAYGQNATQTASATPVPAGVLHGPAAHGAPPDPASVAPAASTETKAASAGSETEMPAADVFATDGASNKFFKPVPANVVLKSKKEKPAKQIPVTIDHGVLTVDGWAGKADLNFQIPDFKYFYVWAPGVGTVVVSSQIFPGSTYQAAAFDGGVLTVTAGGHQIQLTSERRMLGKKPEGAYVRLDENAEAPSRYPEVGYGFTFKAPYAWPGSLADSHTNSNAPPLPVALRPTIQTTKVCTPGSGGQADCRVMAVPMSAKKS